jgi:hypothetical protein
MTVPNTVTSSSFCCPFSFLYASTYLRMSGAFDSYNLQYLGRRWVAAPLLILMLSLVLFRTNFFAFQLRLIDFNDFIEFLCSSNQFYFFPSSDVFQFVADVTFLLGSLVIDLIVCYCKKMSREYSFNKIVFLHMFFTVITSSKQVFFLFTSFTLIESSYHLSAWIWAANWNFCCWRATSMWKYLVNLLILWRNQATCNQPD